MKQGARLFLKPQEFFNQLQWSTHHWLILLTFLVVSGVEAHLGTQSALYRWLAQSLTTQTGISLELTLWLVVSAKLAVILTASYLSASFIWIIGSIIGEKNSQRVLFRRLAVVFTVTLAAYTSQYLRPLYPWMETLSFFLYTWGLLLGYFAIREQFALSHFETSVVGVFAIVLITFSWIGTNRLMLEAANKYGQEIAKISKARPTSNSQLRR
ncbi:MAG: hypothetical protein HQ462_06900 [Deltaproteobacteria bacterium]|nr:hypothetical protein [Deltaproteobacteria bacterium]